MVEKETQQAEPLEVKEVLRVVLPICCPPKTDALWNQHPRVYLPIEATGEAICPYCGTCYRLID